ncbi:DUF6701 domain-containing protein [Colwellia sp. MEBiC06753]
MMRCYQWLTLLLFSLWSQFVWGQCSPYAGKAVINEAYNGNKTSPFVEVFMIDKTISSGVYNNWSVGICARDSKGKTGCDSYSLSSFTSYPWLFEQVSSSLLEFDKASSGAGTDIILLDENNLPIDYLVVNGYMPQLQASCGVADLPYADTININNAGVRLIYRVGDGDGDYSFAPGEKGEQTPGSSNPGTEPPSLIYQIIHDGNGITCLSEAVTIRACTNATCSTTDTSENGSISLLVNGVFSQNINLVNGIGVGSINYTDTVNNAILSSTSDYLCTNTSISGSLGQTDADCGLNFSDTGFVISQIDNQIAGVNFDGITIQAVQANDTGACSALFNNTTDIGFAMQYQVPTSTTANEYQINGTAIAKSVGAPTAYTNISVDFDETGVGIIPNNVYFDAGQVQLHAYKVIPATPELSAVTLIGNSNNFWVKPDQFVLTSSLAVATGVYPAGVDFDYQITAVNSLGQTTTNYLPGSGSVGETIQASIQRVAPVSTAANDGKFTFADTLGEVLVDTSESFIDRGFIFNDGVASASTAEYSEVGMVSLDVRDINYGGIGLEINSDLINLGRFTPAYFVQTVATHGEITGLCGNWAYTGQLLSVGGNGAINYGLQPELIIVAKNGHDITTQNYRNFGVGDNYSFLEDDDVAVITPSQDLKNGVDGVTPYGLSGVINTGTISQHYDEITGDILAGEFTYQFNEFDHFVYTRDANAVTNPFTAEFDIQISEIRDGDNVVDGVNAGILPDALTPVEFRELTNSQLQIRFGRLVLANSFGPETSNLPQPLSTQYLSDAANMTFTHNKQDSCTLISSAASDWTRTDRDTSSGLTAAQVSVQGAGGQMINGVYNGVELKSDNGNQGSVNVEYTTLPWLLFDWAGDGLQDNNAKAVATFGRYRGNDRIIYWKEVNN